VTENHDSSHSPLCVLGGVTEESFAPDYRVYDLLLAIFIALVLAVVVLDALGHTLRALT